MERFSGLLRDSALLDKLAGRNGAGARMVGLAVEVCTALVVHGDRVEVVGRGNVHVFIKSPGGSTITWHTLAHGGRAELKRDRRGEATLVHEMPAGRVAPDD
jgi:hypothetical protein